MEATAPAPERLDTRDLILATALSLLAAIIWLQYGLNGWLWRDDAVYLYAGQQMADGVAPYVSIFDHKTPLAPMLSGWAIMLGRAGGLDDIMAARIGFLILSAMTAGCTYLCGRVFFRDRWSAVFAAVTLIGFWSFGREAVGGPQAKTPLVLFQLLLFLFAARRQWFWAGVAAALATWTWQPYLLFLAAGFAIALCPPDLKGAARARQALLYAAGVLVPSVLIFGYFIYKGALGLLIEGAVSFNLLYLWREPVPLAAQLELPLQTIFRGYSSFGAVILIGTAAVVGWFLDAWRIHGRACGRRPGAIVWVTLPLPLLWSLFDFQGAADVYPILPYAALGFGGLLGLALSSVGRERAAPAWAPVGLFLILVLAAAYPYRTTAESGLENQQYYSSLLDQGFGESAEVLSIGLPEALVLRQQKNANRYVFIINGIDQLIAARTAGGFEAWIAELDASAPRLVALGPTDGPHASELMQWLEASYEKRKIGLWDIYERRPEAGRH